MAPGYDVLAELARQHRESDRTYQITLIAGLLCFWPLLIISYIEYNKTREIKRQVVMMGADVMWWEATYGARSGRIF